MTLGDKCTFNDKQAKLRIDNYNRSNNSEAGRSSSGASIKNRNPDNLVGLGIEYFMSGRPIAEGRRL